MSDLLREYIFELLQRETVVEAAVGISDVPSNQGLIFSANDHVMQMFLVDLKKIKEFMKAKEIPDDVLSTCMIGGITASHGYPWRVNSVWAEHGYGPLLYRLAMQFAYSVQGAISSHGSGITSRAASKVWNRFKTEPDVLKDRGEGKGIRGLQYRMRGDDFKKLASRYDQLGVPGKLDMQLKIILLDVLHDRAH